MQVYSGNFQKFSRTIFNQCVTRFLKHTISYSFPLKFQIKKCQKPTQQSLSDLNESKLYLFLSDCQKIYFGVPQNFSNQFMCAMRWQRLKMAALEDELIGKYILIIKIRAVIIEIQFWEKIWTNLILVDRQTLAIPFTLTSFNNVK